MKCPYCNLIVDLNKKLTWFQKLKEKRIEKMMKRKGFQTFEHQDYYCDCGSHLTIIDGKILSSSGVMKK